MKFRASGMPMLAACSSFVSSTEEKEWAELGTDRHTALRKYFEGQTDLYDMMEEEDQAGIKWCSDYIKLHAPLSDYPVVWETYSKFVGPDFAEIPGTPDCVCGPVVFDFKWRPRDYTAQMATYAGMQIEAGHPRVTVHVCYGAIQRADKLVFDWEAVERVLSPIIARAREPKPTACDYCGWCANRLTCPSLTGPAHHIARAYADVKMEEVTNWHPSEMDKPEHLALALIIWRKVLKKWGESVEFHALEAATKKGQQLPGFELKEKQGKAYVSDIMQAFQLSRLPAEQFLKACDVRLNTSRKYPDRLGLDKVLGEVEGSQAAGKREATKRLAPVIKRTNPSLYLKAAKGGDEEE